MRIFAWSFVILLFASAVMGVSPGTWEHRSEADFAKGKFDAAAVTSLGEIRLSRKVDILMSTETAPEIVSALAWTGEKLYAGSGTDPIVHEVPIAGGDEKAKVFAELPGAMVTTLFWNGQELLVGIGGDEGGICRVDSKGRVRKFWCDEKVKYVWAIERGGDGTIHAATGPEGIVFTIDADGKGEAIYESGKLAKNILSLVRSSDGLLYAGTDEKGLVVQIDLREKTSRVVLDADEAEIAALVIDDKGNVYAATSDAARASARGAPRFNALDVGKPEPLPTTTPTTRPSPETNPADKDTTGDTVQADQGASAVEEVMESQDASPPEDVEEPSEKDQPEVDGPPGPPAAPSPAPPRPGKGNAVYVIRPNGLVETRFRRPLTILGMILHEGRLYLATGNAGGIYSLTRDADGIVQLADIDAKQVTSLVPGANGEIFFATANKGSVGKLLGAIAEKGTFTSDALDASQIAHWGTMRIRTETTGGAKVSIATRSGNVAEVADATWSSWSKEQPAANGFLTIGSPAGRFLQYRLTLSSEAGGSAVVQGVQIIYQVGNLPPIVAAVTVKPSKKGASPAMSTGGSKAFRHIIIKAQDANKDKLSFVIEFRQRGTEGWIEITKDLEKPKYVWDTRTLGDGEYEIRVKCSDAPSNSPETALTSTRISNPIVVDNTAPVIRDLGAKVTDAKVIVSGVSTDASSRIVSVHYSVDSQKEWTVLSAKDGIFDSDTEKFAFDLTDLKGGPHRISVKVADLYGNVGYASVGVTVGG